MLTATVKQFIIYMYEHAFVLSNEKGKKWCMHCIIMSVFHQMKLILTVC